MTLELVLAMKATMTHQPIEVCLDLYYALLPLPRGIRSIAMAPDLWEDFRQHAPIGRGARCTRDNVQFFRSCVLAPGFALLAAVI